MIITMYIATGQEKTNQFHFVIVNRTNNDVSIDAAKLKVIDQSLLPFRIRDERHRSPPQAHTACSVYHMIFSLCEMNIQRK